MVRISMIALAVVSAFSGLVAAKSCKNGGIYCGTYLLKRGDYITKIQTNLLANSLPTSDIYVKQSLWGCIEHGDIKFLQFCAAGCVGGDKKDDYCTGTGKRDAIEGLEIDGEETDGDVVERDVAMEWEA
ncbi:hypothetical protein NHQ30_010891 [Ciborinia camelliae]|nr:hypothetical protein NHQ30_010891 [Ciborinia camelliae]